jgi:putative transposase
MPIAIARVEIELSEPERAELTSMVRSRSLPAALALRARIVLACEGAHEVTQVARSLAINRSTVSKWRNRYAQHRIAGLYDELRPGRPRTVDDEQVAELIAKTLHTKPADGGTHWSTRALAGETGISKSTVNRYLQAFNLKPHRVESFKLSTDPFFIAIITTRAIRRGSFTSVKDLTNKIDKFVNNYNQTCQPFTWTATADSILEKLARLCGRISGTGH